MNNPDVNALSQISPQASALESLTESQTPSIFTITEFALIASCILLGAISLLPNEGAIRLLPLKHEEVIIVDIALISILLLLISLNRRYLNEYRRIYKKKNNQEKSELYSRLFGDAIADQSINIMRDRAIQYCQDLIDDYKDTRHNSRNVYYLFQISTIVLSGVTPILVLLDKVDIDVPWIKWLPVIFPAIASIVTSLSTSFPFQENWMAANTAVELLEAEQEKFILGVTPAYRFLDLPDETQRKRKAQESIESFINQVNKIHLKQLQLATEPDASKSKESTENEASPQTQSASA